MAQPQLILIPGLLCDAVSWGTVPSLLDRDGAVHIADLSTQDDIRQMAADLLARFPAELNLAGHSMGGRVAMEMAHQAPERISRLALLDTGMHPLREGETEKRQEIVEFAFAHGMEALCDRWLPPMVHATRHQDSALMGALRAMVLQKTPELHARQIKALLNRPDASAYAPEIACPTLLVVGRQDAWSPVDQHREMAKVFPNCKLSIIEDAGHFAPAEQPVAVAEELRTWFSNAG